MIKAFNISPIIASAHIQTVQYFAHREPRFAHYCYLLKYNALIDQKLS